MTGENASLFVMAYWQEELGGAKLWGILKTQKMKQLVLNCGNTQGLHQDPE